MMCRKRLSTSMVFFPKYITLSNHGKTSDKPKSRGILHHTSPMLLKSVKVMQQKLRPETTADGKRLRTPDNEIQHKVLDWTLEQNKDIARKPMKSEWSEVYFPVLH